MRMCGTEIKQIIIWVLLLFCSYISSAQITCDCLEDDCDDIVGGFQLEGEEAIVCDGFQFSVTNSTNPGQGITEYIWSWGDGTVDTFPTAQNVMHTYDIVDSLVCDDDKTNFTICLIVKKSCGEGFSCHSASSLVGVIHRPKAIIDIPNQICINTPIQYSNTSCNAETFLWTLSDGQTSMEEFPDLSFSSPGTYTISLEVENECGVDMTTETINVVDEPFADAEISPEPQDGKICVGQILTFTDESNIWSNTSWQILPGGDANWCFTDTTMTLNSPVISVEFKQEKQYTIRLLAENVCGTHTWEEMIDVLDGPTVVLDPDTSFCEMGMYTPSVSYTGDINSYMWTFEGGNPGTSTSDFPTDIMYNEVDSFGVTLVVSSACGDFSVNSSVIVYPDIEIIIDAPEEYCLTSSPDTLSVNVSGGMWSGPGIIDSDLGIFDPMVAGVGPHTLSYMDESNICNSSAEVDITVLPSVNVNTPNIETCENISTVQLQADQAGGTWSGPFVDVDGLFDVESSGVGNFPNEYSFTDVNSCTIINTAFVNVNPVPGIELADTVFLCVSGGIVDLTDETQFSTDQSGGDLEFTVDGMVVPNMYTIGDVTDQLDLVVVYTLGSCITQDSSIIAIVPKETLTVSPDTSVCININTLQLESSLSGGDWSGPGIDMNTGIIDLVDAGDGLNTYQYIIFEGTSCEVSGSVDVDISDPGQDLDAGEDVEICQDEFSIYTLSGFSPSGGSWSGDGILDSNLGTIDVTQLTLDSIYIYRYCIESNAFEDCEACDELNFVIRPIPIPSFEVDGGLCVGDIFTIVNNTVNGENYTWDFGDGMTSTEVNPSHSYTSSGNYTIVLDVISSDQCRNDTSLTIYVSEPPLVDFSVDITEGCAPLSIQLTNNSSGDNISYQWVIDMDTFTVQTPEDIILDGVTQDSIINITLYVNNDCGTVSQNIPILVHPYPIVRIDTDEDEGCSPLEVKFGNATIGNPETYFWDLGNGTTLTDSIPPIQTYTTTDSTVSIYTISLISTNECGEGSQELEITVYPPDVEAFIGMDTMMVCQYDSFTVNSVSTPGSIITWSVFDEQWNMIDGFNENSPTISINQKGRFAIVLYASRCGTDTDTAYIDILPAPEIDFILPEFACLGDSVLFESLSDSLSETIWDFGDGSSSEDATVYHLFDSVGIFDISLTGYSIVNNCPFTLTKQIEIIGLPNASFGLSQMSGCRPLEVEFENQSTGGNSYNWTWGDTTSASTEESPTHIFNDAGTFSVSLRVFDEFGCFSDTNVVNIIVHDLPKSSFVTDEDSYCQFYDSIYVTNNSIDAVSNKWIVEGDTIDELEPVIFSENVGPLAIILQVENIHGCVDSAIQVVDILPSAIAEVTPNDTSGCQPLHINFINLSEQADNFVWNINNQETSSDVDLIFEFPDAGLQEVELIARTLNGCPEDTALISIQVLPKPESDFTFLKTSECGVPMEVSFINNSNADIIDYEWSFGNGDSSQLDEPITEYFSDADFNVELIVENTFECKDTSDQDVPIWQQPEALFDTSIVKACEGELIEVLNNSTFANSSFWEVGGLISEEADLSIQFDESGDYDIRLIVSYNEFCQDTLDIDSYIEVYTQPVADFTFDVDYDPDIIGNVDFENRSLDYSNLKWFLGDGAMSEEESFTHEYDINRDIEVILIAINENGGLHTCRDTIIKDIAPEWITTFFAPNAFTPQYGSEEVSHFIPKGIGLVEYDLKIVSPWGQQVWSASLLEDGRPIERWNGKINNTGKDVAQGSYTWFANIKFEDGIEVPYIGTVTVIR